MVVSRSPPFFPGCQPDACCGASAPPHRYAYIPLHLVAVAVGDRSPIRRFPSASIHLSHVAGIPSVQLRVGTVEPREFARAKASGTTLPGPHNGAFAPDREPTIRGGVAALTISALELLAKP